MKIELIEETFKLTGEKRYSIEVDGLYHDYSCTRDINEAKAKYAKLLEGARTYPETTKATIESVEL